MSTRLRVGMLVHRHDDRAVSRLVTAVSGELARSADVTLLRVQAARTPAPVPAGVQVVTLAPGAGRTATAVPALAKELRRGRLDVLFAHLNGPGRAALLARAWARADLAVVPVAHVHYDTFYRHRSWWQDPLTVLLYPRAEAVAGVSASVVEELARHVPRLPTTAVLPVVGPDERRLSRAGDVVGHPWFDDSPRPRLVCSVANLVPRKGQEVLLRALPSVRERAGDVRLVLVGRPDDEAFAARLADLAVVLGVDRQVWFAGYRDDPISAIAQSDVLVLASETEGLPTVLVEAMACGTPVVATDSPGGCRSLLGDGRFGQLVAVGDVAGVATAVVGALTDDRWRVGVPAEARRHAESFTARNVARRYLQVAEQAVATRRDRRDRRAGVGGR